MTLQRFGTTGMTRNRIGIFGGTFNPIHKAHKQIALEFIEKLGLDLLYVIPNSIPPMKQSHGVSGEERLEMLNIAFDGCERVIVSDIEIKRGGMSYTCDTVSELRKKHPNDELFLLLGDDWINRFDRWRNYKDILNDATLVIAWRGEEDVLGYVERLYEKSGKRALLLMNERIELSSTAFRVRRDKSLLPTGVYEYIEERGLYRND